MNNTQEQELQEYGKRIAFFLDALNTPVSLKKVIVELLPNLALDQIEEMRIKLEEQVVEQTAIEMTPEYQEKMAKINNETASDLDVLLADIK